MAYIGPAPASSVIGTTDIGDNVITSPKLATTFFTGATDIGANIADADLFLMDDGAGGTIRKSAASRIKTYAGTDLTAVADGSVGSPSIANSGDTNTGIYWPGADQLGLTTAGAAGLLIDATGAVTKPLQPCVLVHPTTAQNNIPTNTSTTIVWGTEVFDVGGDFASNTFTAPVTGKYLCALCLDMDNWDQDANYYQVQFASSNRDRYGPIMDPDAYDQDLVYGFLSKTIILDMDTNDTLTVLIREDGGSGAQTDIRTDSTLSICLIA